MAFKSKPKNRLLIEERQTLDAKHNHVLQLFNEQKTHIPDIKSKLEVINARLEDLKRESDKSLIINLKIQSEIWELDDKKKELEKEIDNIQNNKDENEYMLKTGKILSKYYKIIDKEKQFSLGNETPPPTISPLSNTMMNGNKKRSIIDWFAQSIDNNILFENIDTGKKQVHISKKKINSQDKIINISQDNQSSTFNTTINNPLSGNNLYNNISNQINSPKNNNISDNNISDNNISDNNISDNNIFDNNIFDNSIFDNNNTLDKTPKNDENKDIIYEKYMKIIDKNYINISNDDSYIFDSCKKCLVEMLLNNNTGILICPKCGIIENIIVDSDKPSFKEPPKEMTSFCYKRINHLNEFLAQFQAKETTDIHEDVYNEILMEIKKERITNMALITPKKMRTLLKKIKKNDYYEHIPYIINQLNGLPAPVIAPEIEEIIRGMFKAIQIPFEKYCPAKRKNFLSYNYIMYKFFELLELDEYLRCFQLLKSRTKLHQQDLIWKNICKDLNWQFIKSL